MMNLDDISTQLLFTTAPIWIEREDSTSFGSSFILSIPVPGADGRQVPVLVTNAHVVSGAKRGLVDLVEREGDQPKQGKRIRAEIDGASLTRFVNDADDLAMIPIGGLLNQAAAAGRQAFYRSVSIDLIPKPETMEQLSAVEEVTFIGYPSGLYDEHNVSPVVRQGITATPAWYDFQGRSAFLIDAGVFPGSSGSPVFILNQGAYATKGGLTIGSRLLFMGVLTEAITRTEQGVPPVFLGIGRVIKSARVREFASQVVTELLGHKGSVRE